MSKRLRTQVRVLLGTLLSTGFAAILALLFHRSTMRGVLPLAFVFVLVVLSRYFGVGVSLTGSLSAAIVFALLLFPPLGSTSVESPGARMNLAWMILGAVAISYLLYPPRYIGRH